MRSLVDGVITPNFSEQKEKLGLPEMQKSIWQIDVWSVHHSKEFCEWMKKAHLNITYLQSALVSSYHVMLGSSVS